MHTLVVSCCYESTLLVLLKRLENCEHNRTSVYISIALHPYAQPPAFVKYIPRFQLHIVDGRPLPPPQFSRQQQGSCTGPPLTRCN